MTSYMLSLLAKMRSRPIAMWVGSKSLAKLADFLGGYELALFDLGIEDPFRLLEFGNWLRERFKVKSALGWWTIIGQQSKDDADAVDRFWELLDDFFATHPQFGIQELAPAVPPVPKSVRRQSERKP